MTRLTTAGGYSMFEAVSALQKTIRRGDEEQAVFWAQELESRYWRYVWQRLQVISHEDIGPANPQAAIFTYIAAKQYEEQREKGKLMTLSLINTVIILCRSPKSREADHLLSIVYHQADVNPEVPDFAYDHHTSKGKKMGRGLDFFYDVAAKIHPDHDSGLYLERARAIDKNKRTRTWWTELKDRLRRGGKKPKKTPEQLLDEGVVDDEDLEQLNLL